MKISIDVKDRKEGEAIRAAMDDPEIRAFVIVVGTLKPFSQRGRKRILSFVADSLDEADSDTISVEFDDAGS